MAMICRIRRYGRAVLVLIQLAWRPVNPLSREPSRRDERQTDPAVSAPCGAGRLSPRSAGPAAAGRCGLPEDCNPGRRRTPGLRREEVAQISGVSVTWYTWLEQARNISAWEQVIEALARALLLDHDQRRHIRGLAGLPAAAGETHTDDGLPRLQRLADAAAPNIDSIYDMHFGYAVWNTPYRRLRHNPGVLPADRRNLLWMMFNDTQNRARMVRREPAARAVLSQFRVAAGQRPDDPRFAAITRS